MRNKQSCSMKLFSGVGLALAAGLVVLGGMTTGALAQAPAGGDYSGLDALGKAINDADLKKQAAEIQRKEHEKAMEEAMTASSERVLKEIIGERKGPPPKPPKAEENPDVVPIIGDSSVGGDDVMDVKREKKAGKSTVGASTGEQSATIHSKSNHQAKIGGVVAHEATAPRLQTKPASAKPPALAAAPKPPTPTLTAPAAGASTGLKH